MFSLMCVCLSTGGSHVTITHDALELTAQSPPTPGPQETPSTLAQPTPRHVTLEYLNDQSLKR